MSTTAAPGRSRRARATALRVSRSAARVTVQVLMTTTSRASANRVATTSISAALVRQPRLMNVAVMEAVPRGPGRDGRGSRAQRVAYQPPSPAGRRRGSIVEAQHGHEGVLGDLDRAHPLHPPLALLLPLQELALAGHVAAIALGEHVLAHGRDGLAGDHPAPDGRLQRHL